MSSSNPFSEKISKVATAILNKISTHENKIGSSSQKGHVQASSQVGLADKSGGAAGTDNGIYARADHQHILSDAYATANHTHNNYLTSHQDISGKLDKNQGTSNNGKFLKVNSSGDVTCESVSIPSAITVDSSLSSSSTNPVQNKVINSALSDKASSTHNHDGTYLKSYTPPTSSTSQAGIVQLNNTVSSTSTTQAATANAVKTAYDLANGKPSLGTTSTTAAAGDHTHSQYLTSHQDISGKLDKSQGTSNSGKFLKVNSSGNVACESVTIPSAYTHPSTKQCSYSYTHPTSKQCNATIPSGSSTATDIKMNGSQSAGSSSSYAKADHVHPSDTSRVAVSQGTTNSGKFLKVNSSGNVTCESVTIPSAYTHPTTKQCNYSYTHPTAKQCNANIPTDVNELADDNDIIWGQLESKYDSNGRGLTEVAFSGSYNDLDNKPTIPTIDSSLSPTSTNAVQNKVINTALGTKAKQNHASSSTTYGVATTSNYGHVKVADNLTTSSFSADAPVVLTAYQGKKLKDYINAIRQTKITASSYDVQIDTDITVTVSFMDAYGGAVSGESITLLCDKGYFNNDTTAKSITATTDSNGKITTTWTASEWGLCTFRTSKSHIQVNVTGWKEIELTNATLYVNGYSRICELIFNKTMNVTSSYSTVETYSIIANNYPVLGNVYTATYSPAMSVMLKSNGVLQVKGTTSANNASVQGSIFWHY